MTTQRGGPAPDREAVFRQLFEQTYADLVRFAQRRVHPSHAEDVVADAMLAAWRRFDDLPADHGDARAWLFGIVRNTILNDRRGAERRRSLTVRIADVSWSSVGTDTGRDAEAIAQRVDLSAAWRRLSEVHQETLALAVWDDLSAPQAAAVLGISPVAFRLRLTRARRALRNLLASPTISAPVPAGLSERNPS